MTSRHVQIGTAIGGSLLLAACSVGAPATPTETIRFGTYESIDALPAYVIESQGFDVRNGFRIVLSEPYASGLAGAQALAADEIDVTYPGIPPLLTLSVEGTVPRDVAVVAVSAVATAASPEGAVLVRPGVDKWKDLEASQVGTHNVNSISAASFAARAKDEGIDSFEFVKIGFADMGLAVRDGVVAAAIVSEPYLSQSLLRGDGTVLGYALGQPPLDDVPFNAIAVRADLVAEPATVARFLRAHIEAVRYIRDKPAEARQLLVTRLGFSEDVAQRVALRDWPTEPRLALDDLARLQSVLLRAGAIKQTTDLGAFHDPSILESVLSGG